MKCTSNTVLGYFGTDASCKAIFQSSLELKQNNKNNRWEIRRKMNTRKHCLRGNEPSID